MAKIQLDRNVGRELIFKGKREMPWLWFWGSDGTLSYMSTRWQPSVLPPATAQFVNTDT